MENMVEENPKHSREVIIRHSISKVIERDNISEAVKEDKKFTETQYR